MSSFIRYTSSFEYNFGIYDSQELIGNLRKVNESNLCKAEPKDFKFNKYYLLINNETNEKTIGRFIRSEEIYNRWYELVKFDYIFRDKFGELNIDGYNLMNNNKNPYCKKKIKLANQFNIYIPNSYKIILKKLENMLLPDIVNIILEYC